MPSIRWGRFAGNNRGGTGHVGKGGKCDRTQGKDAATCKKGEGIKKKGVLHSRCVKSPVVDVLIEIKNRPTQEEGVVQTIDSCERNVDAKCVDASAKISSKRSRSLREEGIIKKIDLCQKSVYAECKTKQGIKNSACIEQDIRRSECVESEEHITSTRNCIHMMHAELNAFSMERKKRADSSYTRVDAACTDNTKAVVYDKAGDSDCAKAVVYDKAGDSDCANAVVYDNAGDGVCARNTEALTQAKPSTGLKDVRRKVCSPGIGKENDFHKKNVDALVMVPHDFVCGISKKVMEDPVVVASGQTFERACIQAWLDDGNTLCPSTHKPLSHLQLIPNLTLKTLISSWSQSQEVRPETTHQSFSSCMSSLSSCPSLMTPHHQSFISCSSFSVSKLLRDTEPCCSSSSSTSSLPKLLFGGEPHSFSSSSLSARWYGTPEHLIAGGIHNFPSTPSSTASSSCWEQEGEVYSLQEKEGKELPQLVGSTQRKQGENRTTMSKTRSTMSKMSPGCTSNDPIPDSTKSDTYIASRIKGLVSDLGSEYIDIQRNAAAELRLLAKHVDSNRVVIANAGAVRPLLTLLLSKDESIQLDATTTLLNLSLNHTLKEHILKEATIEALVQVLRDGLSAGAKENAAVALACLAIDESNKHKMGAAGAVVPLLDLLDRGSPRGKKDAAAALYRLSSIDENKRRMVRAGVSKLLVDFMSGEGEKDVMVDKAMSGIMANKARSGVGEKDAKVDKAMSGAGKKDVIVVDKAIAKDGMVDKSMSGEVEKDVIGDKAIAKDGMVDKAIAKDGMVDKAISGDIDKDVIVDKAMSGEVEKDAIAISGKFMSIEERKVEDKAIAEGGMVDKAIAILGNLVSIEEGRVAFVEEGGIITLMEVMQGGSKRSKKLAVPILLQLCTHSSKHRSLILQKEPLPTLMALSKTGNSRLKTQVAEVIQVLIVDAYA